MFLVHPLSSLSHAAILGSPVAKLGDFGLSVLVQNELRRNEEYGALANIMPRYTAPEILLGKKYDTKVDVYAFGVLLWELSYRRIVYTEDDYKGPFGMEQIAKDVKSGKIPPLTKNDSIDNLIKSCLQLNPNDRLTSLGVCEELREMIQIEAPDLFLNLPPQSISIESPKDIISPSISYEWERTHQMPNPLEGERSHRIVCSVLADSLLWVGCNNGSIGVIDIEGKSFDPIFASKHWLPLNSSSPSAITAIEYVPSLHQIWTANNNGVIQACCN